MDEHNPTFIYDGRRMRTLTDRKYTDYASPCIYSFDTIYKPFVTSKITKNLQHISVNKIRSPVHCLAFTKDGRRLISGSMSAHESCVRSILTTDSLILSGDANGTIKFWDLSLTNIFKKELFSESIRDISTNCFEDKIVASGDNSVLKIVDLSTGSENALEGHLWDVRQAKWHKTKALIVSGGKDTTTKLWDPRQKKCLRTLHLHKNAIFTLQYSRDGNCIFSGGKDQTLRVLDIRTLKSFSYKNQGSDISKIVEHPHADLIVACSATGGMYFYQNMHQSFLIDNYNSEFLKKKENPDHTAPISVEGQESAQVLSISDPKNSGYEWIDSLNKAHDHVIWSAEYHPVGHVLATGSLDQSIRWWTRFGENRPIDRSNPVVPEYHKTENDEIKEEIPGL